MPEKENFFQHLLNTLFGNNNPDNEKKKLLKSITKTISKTKYHYYKVSSHSVDSSLAKLFYDIYKIVSPFQFLFQSTTQNAMKNVVISSSLTQKQNTILEELTEENVHTLSHTIDFKELESRLKKNIDQINTDFLNGEGDEIDILYNQLAAFRNFCTFDFYFMLKKFDSSLKEHDFISLPHFQAISGNYILEDLKNFIAVAWALPFESDFTKMFELLNRIKGSSLINNNTWKKLSTKLQLIKQSNVFEMMIQLISEDPLHEEKISFSEEHIIEPYMKQLNAQVNGILNKIKEKQTSNRVDLILTQIFGGTPEQGLKNYTKGKSLPFEQKKLGSFEYCAPLSYLKAFLIDFTKQEMRELSDILLVRGKWTSSGLSSPMSDAYNALLECSPKISEFDSVLSEDTGIGLKLKTFLPRAERDKDASDIITTILNDTNNTAKKIITDCAQNYIIYGRSLKALIEDFQKGRQSELIINWAELDRFAENGLKTTMITVYKKIYYFISLLQNFSLGASK